MNYDNCPSTSNDVCAVAKNDIPLSAMLNEALESYEKSNSLDEKYEPVYNRMISVLNKLHKYKDINPCLILY